MRWLISISSKNENEKKKKKSLELVGTYVGHLQNIRCVVEKEDGKTFVTASDDLRLMEWNVASRGCVASISIKSVACCLTRTKDKTRLVSGHANGWIDIRRSSDLTLESTFRRHWAAINCICELTSDGSFVTGSNDGTLVRWNPRTGGSLIQVFSGHADPVCRVVELRHNIFVSATRRHSTIESWDLSTGGRLKTWTSHSSDLCGLETVSSEEGDVLVSVSVDRTMRVWSERGDLLQSLELIRKPMAMTKLPARGDSIVTVDSQCMEVRRLYVE